MFTSVFQAVKEGLPFESSGNELPPLEIHLTDVNRYEHLTAIVRNSVHLYLPTLQLFSPVRNANQEESEAPLMTPTKEISEHSSEEPRLLLKGDKVKLIVNIMLSIDMVPKRIWMFLHDRILVCSMTR